MFCGTLTMSKLEIDNGKRNGCKLEDLIEGKGETSKK